MYLSPAHSRPHVSYGLTSVLVSVVALFIGSLSAYYEILSAMRSQEEVMTIIFQVLLGFGLTAIFIAGGLFLSTVLAAVALWKKEKKILPVVSLSLNALVVIVIGVLLVKIGTG